MNKKLLEGKIFDFDPSISNNETGKHAIKTISLPALLFLLLLFPIITVAQAVSGVTGVITDTTGALLPGVEVRLVDTKTSREFTATTSDQGVYIFSNVQPGDGYRLTFT